jgi:HK97 gp10 family phage protein
MSVRIEGFKFAALTARMRKNIAGAVNNAADSCVSLGQQLAPVDTGFMRDNIKQTDSASAESLRAVVESGADYSAFVEYGTVNMDAQPFFTPAFESARRQLNNELLRVLR